MSISTYTVTAVVCDGCCDEHEGAVGRRRAPSEARCSAAVEGWREIDCRDLCPKCARARRETQP